MPLIKYAEILAQEDVHTIYLGTIDDVQYYFVKVNGCNFAPLPKTWWELEAWSIGHRTYRFARREDHTGLLVQIDVAKFNAEYDKLPW